MNELINQFSRRKFLLTAGASAVGAVTLNGCLGNPPDSSSNTQAQQVSAVNISPEQAPETTKVKLGYIPIVEAAPLIIAQEKGFFAKYGMTGVELAKQASWGSMRDNTEIGSSGGGVDGGGKYCGVVIHAQRGGHRVPSMECQRTGHCAVAMGEVQGEQRVRPGGLKRGRQL